MECCKNLFLTIGNFIRQIIVEKNNDFNLIYLFSNNISSQMSLKDDLFFDSSDKSKLFKKIIEKYRLSEDSFTNDLFDSIKDVIRETIYLIEDSYYPEATKERVIEKASEEDMKSIFDTQIAPYL